MMGFRAARFVLGLLIVSCTTLQILLWSKMVPEWSENVDISSFVHHSHRYRKPTEETEVVSFPPQCTSEQQDNIRYQLPPNRCMRTRDYPWQNRCSFSYATRCPDAIWLTEYYNEERQRSYSSSQQSTAIYVGCNKGMDAINTLRMMSSNKAIDKELWRDTLFANRTVHYGHCNQENEPQYEIPKNHQQRQAKVYCIEAMPNSAEELWKTSQMLGWQEKLIVTNAAMASTDGMAYFPYKQANVADVIGLETAGIDNCRSKQEREFCKQIPKHKLETYVARFVENGTPINLLSIDVEGFDWDVILGASAILDRVHYIEFEYSWKGTWKETDLSSAIDTLKSRGFVCYFAGTFGNIWRITDCFMDYYNLKFWSNVACVSLKHAEVESMAKRMEELFRETLASARQIRYHNASSATTDGRLNWGLETT